MGASEETVAAVATPPGRGGIGIVRVSGPLVADIAQAVLGETPPPRQAIHRTFIGAGREAIDDGIALFFPGPNSFTGEDLLELQGHGGPVVMDMLLGRVLELGARSARPGEFSQRAFLNDKIDLAQAEAIADLIDSASVQAARSARRSLQGDFSQCIDSLVAHIVDLRTYVEASIDFPEEDVDFLSDGQVQRRLETIQWHLADTFASAQQGYLLKEGLTIAIAGRPNVGKSSLLNQLTGRESAIVTDLPGTTRDPLREYIQIDGIPLHLVDTAGLRPTDDTIERIGIERAWDAINEADVILLVLDDGVGITEPEETLLGQLRAEPPPLVVRNKIDLSHAPPSLGRGRFGSEVCVSAKTGAGMELLKQQLKDAVGYRPSTEGSFMARRRHLEALSDARAALDSAVSQLTGQPAGELLAEDLRQAHRALGQITGEFSTEDLLGRIFSSFCIGK